MNTQFLIKKLEGAHGITATLAYETTFLGRGTLLLTAMKHPS